MNSDPCNKKGSVSAAGSPSSGPAGEWLGQIKVEEFNYEQGNEVLKISAARRIILAERQQAGV